MLDESENSRCANHNKGGRGERSEEETDIRADTQNTLCYLSSLCFGCVGCLVGGWFYSSQASAFCCVW